MSIKKLDAFRDLGATKGESVQRISEIRLAFIRGDFDDSAQEGPKLGKGCPAAFLALPISSFPDKPLVLQFFDWVLRGLSQVVFVSNPISGILILVGLLVQNPWWALTGFVGTVVSTLTALVLSQDR